MKSVCFVLPEIAGHPVGGYKIVFEYANRLVSDDFNVSILFLNDLAFKKHKIPKIIKNPIQNYRTILEPRWFNLDKRIKKISSTQLKFKEKLQDVDIVIATAVETVYPTLNLFKNSEKFYLIQGLEDWNVSREDLFKTYNMGFKKIVISKWLKKIVDENSQDSAVYIKNPIDIKRYHVITPIEERSKYAIGMLNHSSLLKGSKDGLQAIELVRLKYPNLRVYMFGTVKPAKNLPNWIDYTWNASTEETIDIYNRISIFVNPSIKEGFGLTGLEAMACGAALASTKYAGVKEYAVDNDNALLSPVKDPRKLADNIEKLITNPKLRMNIAKAGVLNAQRFSWDDAYKKFKKVILS